MIRFRLRKHEVRFALLGVTLLFLVGLIFSFWSQSETRAKSSEFEGWADSGAEKSRGVVPSVSRGFYDKRIRTKVHSLLDVRKGEVGMIQIPAADLAKIFSIPDQSPEMPNGSPGIGGLYSRDQLAPILEGLLRDGKRLQATVGNGKGMAISGRKFGIEILEVNDRGAISDLSIGTTNVEGGRSGRMSLSVFNGHALLMLSGSNDNPEGLLIVTGTDPEKAE